MYTIPKEENRRKPGRKRVGRPDPCPAGSLHPSPEEDSVRTESIEWEKEITIRLSVT